MSVVVGGMNYREDGSGVFMVFVARAEIVALNVVVFKWFPLMVDFWIWWLFTG